MKRLLPILILLSSSIIHFILLRKPLDTFLWWLSGIATLLPIYFSDEIGSFTGYQMKGGYIDEPTPGIIIKIIGWLGLLFICFILITGVPFDGRRY